MSYSYNPYAPNHRLDRVMFTLTFDPTPDPQVITGRAWGESNTRRRVLWSEASVWSEEDSNLSHAPADWLHHIALVAVQDRPNSSERLLFSLTGGLGEQGTLPLF